MKANQLWRRTVDDSRDRVWIYVLKESMVMELNKLMSLSQPLHLMKIHIQDQVTKETK